jgi:hypothetical protein
MAPDDEFDDLAAALVETDFDAVERGGYRAAWVDEGQRVEVTAIEGGRTVRYNAEDLVRATSDREVNNAREPDEIQP